MVRLSVNINKIATLRNARGGNIPDVVKAASDIEQYGAHGITVPPGPDERPIRKKDVYDLKKIVKTEFNIEGYPSEEFLLMIGEIKPAQATLVPDLPDVLTSNAGWNTKTQFDFLKKCIERIKDMGVRTSLFIDPVSEMIERAAETGTDRVELYTEAYASGFDQNPEQAIAPYVKAAETAIRSGLRLNAGHDLNLNNLRFFKTTIIGLDEVSIGHALISDALYYGLENTVQMYLRQLR
jgi:pyridoxine 5-phosphate synthase